MFAIIYSYSIFQQIFFYFFKNNSDFNNTNYVDKKLNHILNFKDMYKLNYLLPMSFEQNSLFFTIYKNNFFFFKIIFFFILGKLSLNNNLVSIEIKNNLMFNSNFKSKNNIYKVFLNTDNLKILNKKLNIFNDVLKQTMSLKTYFNNLNIIGKKKNINLNLDTNYQIKYSVSDFFKNLNGLTLNYINLLFLRKNKVFNKGRYSRNRQYYRTGVY